MRGTLKHARKRSFFSPSIGRAGKAPCRGNFVRHRASRGFAVGKAELGRAAPVLNRFTEGFDTGDLIAARELLNELGI